MVIWPLYGVDNLVAINSVLPTLVCNNKNFCFSVSGIKLMELVTLTYPFELCTY